MSRNKLLTLVSAVCLIIAATFTACSISMTALTNAWKTEFDIKLPELGDELMSDFGLINEAGWYATLIDDFEGSAIDADEWGMFPSGKRDDQYWCDQQVKIDGGVATINAEYCEEHECETCPIKSGYFTSGIQTMDKFEQAFGFYEVRVRVPAAMGITSMFSTTTTTVGQMGDRGRDGTKIDVFESAFYNSNHNNVGHSLKYDIDVNSRREIERVTDTKTDLYTGFNTYALLWTPTHYVFFVNDVATWATDFGGVSEVPAYLMIGNSIKTDIVGPYNSVLGSFSMTEQTALEIDYVRVYQNQYYEQHIRTPESF